MVEGAFYYVGETLKNANGSTKCFVRLISEADAETLKLIQTLSEKLGKGVLSLRSDRSDLNSIEKIERAGVADGTMRSLYNLRSSIVDYDHPWDGYFIASKEENRKPGDIVEKTGLKLEPIRTRLKT